MKRLVYLLSLCLIMATFILVTFTSCNKAQKGFNSLLIELADNDATIDANDWMKLKGYLVDHKTKLSSFFSNREIDIEKVKSYIIDFFSNRRPPKTICFFGINGGSKYLTVKFYLERSGSTYGYDTPQCSGDFKAAIVSLLNNLPGNNGGNTDFIVNDNIYIYPKSYREFIIDKNIFETTKGLGNPSYTDFNRIFSSLLSDTKNNEIAILVTDMIYSVKEMQGVSPQKIFNEEEGMANAVFSKHVKDKTVLVIQMKGDYVGEYYPYNSGKKGIPYKGKRPYYFVIVGNNSDIQRLSSDSQYSSFIDFSKMGGFSHVLSFNSTGTNTPYYTISLEDPNTLGKFKCDRNGSKTINSLKDIDPDRESGAFQFTVAVDLKGILADKEYLLDKNNYEISSEDKVTIQQIRKITSADITPNNRDNLSLATHFIVLRINNFTHKQVLHLRLKNILPPWVAQTSSDDDLNVHVPDFPNTTFGFKYMMNGIYKAYSNYSGGNVYYFDLQIDLNK